MYQMPLFRANAMFRTYAAFMVGDPLVHKWFNFGEYVRVEFFHCDVQVDISVA